jgi:hypothetical protein
MRRPGVLVGLAVVAAVAGFQLWISPTNPPGFHRDEASISYNASTLATDLRDQNGALLPLYFPSFDDYKSPLFVYALAGAFRLTGPDADVARGLAAVSVLAAVLLLGLIASRRSRNAVVAVVVIVLAGTTPWLFELGRVAFEVSMEPLVLCLLLLAVDRACRAEPGSALSLGVPIGLALGALTYVYAGGRLLAPLLAAALVLAGGQGRWRWIVAAWTTFAMTLVPLLVYVLVHPGALTQRFWATTFIQEGMSRSRIVRGVLENYARDVNLWEWVTRGDPKPYVHASNYGMLFATAVLLALAGAGLVLLRHRDDPWWRFVLAATVVSPVPAALTEDRLHALRLVPLAVLMLVLAVPALCLIVRTAATRPVAAAAVATVLAVATAAQFVDFLDRYRESGPGRIELFEAGVPRLLDRGFADGATLHLDFDDHQAQAHALWRSAELGLPRGRVVVLGDGATPAAGSIVFGRFQECDFVCEELDRWGEYWLARVREPQ